MMVLIRFVLVSLIVYLIIKSFIRYGYEKNPSDRKPEQEKGNKINSKRVSKEIGEYTDYEEVDK
jgi:hypothetical protein